MKTIKIAAAIALVAALAGCTKQAETTVRAGVDFQVDKLFAVDGCTVYRFEDGGRPRYFTNCRGSAQWEESCGKGCTDAISVGGGK